MTADHARGIVSVRDIARGSKSEQPAVVLQTDERSWVLRRSDGPSFGVDDELAAWAGQSVDAVGVAGNSVFLLTEPLRAVPTAAPSDDHDDGVSD
jgi:hypothetical protein